MTNVKSAAWQARHNPFMTLFPFWMYSFFFQLAGSLHFIYIPVFGERILPIWAVGFAMGAATLIQLLLDIPAGKFLDRVGYVRMLKVTVMFFLAAAFALMFGLSHVTFFITLVFSALGWLFFGPGSDAYILSTAPRNYTGRYISIGDVARSLGTVVTTVIFALVLDISAQMLGVALFMILLIALLFVNFIRPEKRKGWDKKMIKTQHYYIRRHPIRHLLKTIKKLNPASSMLLLTSFVTSVFYAVVWFVLPIALVQELESGALSYGLAVFDLAVVLLGAYLGKLADTGDKQWMVFYGLFIFATFGLLTGFMLNAWFLLFGFLATVGDELSAVSLWAWMNDLDRDHAEDGFVAGLITFAGDLGWTVGPILAGLLYVPLGPKWTIAVGAILAFFTWFVYALVPFRQLVAGSVREHGLPPRVHRKKHKH